MPDFSGLQSIVEFQESLWHMWFILLITIGVLSILSSEVIFTVARPFYAWLEQHKWTLVTYFFQCDLCKGFWLTLWLCWLYDVLPLTLVCYGLLAIYVSWRDRDA